MVDLLIRNANILQLIDETATILYGQDILVVGNRIEAIGPTGRLDASHAKTSIDAKGQLAMPGFHQHACPCGDGALARHG